MTISARAAWLVAGRIAGDVLSFALFILIAREFGPDGIGIYAFHFAVATILYEFVTLGIEEYGVREYASRAMEARKQLISDLLGAQLVVSLAALVVIVALLIMNVLERSHTALLAFMITYQVACAIAYTLFIPAFVSGRVATMVSSEVASRVGILALAAVLIAAGEPTLTTALVGLPAFGFSLLAVAGWMAHRLGNNIVPLITWRNVAEVLQVLWSFAAASLLLVLWSRLGVIFLFLLASSAQAGLFSSAFKFAEVIWIILSMLPWAAYARLSTLYHHEPEGFRSLSLDVLRATLLCSGVAAWGLFWILPLVVPTLLGVQFAGTESVLRNLAVLVPFLGVSAYLSRMMLVAELQVIRFRIALAQTALALILSLILIPRLGIYGAVIALVATQCSATLLEFGALRALPGHRQVIRTFGVFVLCIAGAVVAGEFAEYRGGAAWLAPASSLVTFLLAARIGGLFCLTRRMLAS